MKVVNKKFGFEKGWKMIPQGEVNTVKEELKEALGITTDQALLPRRKGLVIPTMLEKEYIENVFEKHGITDIWGDVGGK